MSFTPCPLLLVGLLEDHPRVEGGVGARRVVRGRERGRALAVVGPRDAEVELRGGVKTSVSICSTSQITCNWKTEVVITAVITCNYRTCNYNS